MFEFFCVKCEITPRLKPDRITTLPALTSPSHTLSIRAVN